MAPKIQLRRDISTNWSTQNTTLSSGEIGIDKTNSSVKIGDGATQWDSLPYSEFSTQSATISGAKTFLAPISLYKQAGNPASIENVGQIFEKEEFYYIDPNGITAQLTCGGNIFRDIAQVYLTMVDTSMIQLATESGLRGLLYVNGEICDLTNTRTISHTDTMLNTDGTDSTSPTQGGTLLHVYASNSSVESMPNQIRTSVFSSNTNKYLGDSGIASNWRLVGWVYPITVSGTPYFVSDSANKLVCSKWNPKVVNVLASHSGSHTYNNSNWRKWLNTDNTLTKYIIHEDYTVVDVSIMDYKTSESAAYPYKSSVSFDSVTGQNPLTTGTYGVGGLDGYGHATIFYPLTFGYHYSYAVESGYGTGQSFRYVEYYITIMG